MISLYLKLMNDAIVNQEYMVELFGGKKKVAYGWSEVNEIKAFWEKKTLGRKIDFANLDFFRLHCSKEAPS